MIPTMGGIRPIRKDPFRLVIPRAGAMRVGAEVYLGEGVPVEPESLSQLADAASLPGVVRVLATPDIHVGFGVPIGAVVAAEDFISPAAVGYDINCGMRLLATPLDAREVEVRPLAEALRRVVPLGEGKTNLRLSDKALRRTLAEGVAGLLGVWRADRGHVENAGGIQDDDLEWERVALSRIERMGSLPGDPDALPPRALSRGAPQLGTLGGGNHFIEFQRVDRVYRNDVAERLGIREGQLVIMIHSGSRGLGHEVGGHFMQAARRYDAEKKIPIPSAQLAILPLGGGLAQSYLGAMNAAANYAFANRAAMAMLARQVMRRRFPGIELRTVYDVAHNLAAVEEHGGRRLMIHRKGATRAFPAERMQGTPFADVGQPVLIPGSMGTASYLLRGIAEGAAALFSTNHGAGRVMSRTAAAGKGRGKRRRGGGLISDEAFRQSMAGVCLICEDARGIKEEAPAAYKDIDRVIETVCGARLAEAVARMVPLAVLKG